MTNFDRECGGRKRLYGAGVVPAAGIATRGNFSTGKRDGEASGHSDSRAVPAAMADWIVDFVFVFVILWAVASSGGFFLSLSFPAFFLRFPLANEESCFSTQNLESDKVGIN